MALYGGNRGRLKARNLVGAARNAAQRRGARRPGSLRRARQLQPDQPDTSGQGGILNPADRATSDGIQSRYDALKAHFNKFLSDRRAKQSGAVPEDKTDIGAGKTVGAADKKPRMPLRQVQEMGTGYTGMPGAYRGHGQAGTRTKLKNRLPIP